MQIQYYFSELNKPDISGLQSFTLKLDIVIILIMIVMAVIIVIDNILKWKRFAKEHYIEPFSGGDKDKVPPATLTE
jgi:hypothetical protein